MGYTIKKELKKLSDEHFARDVKRYLKSPYEFYGIRVPELRVMAKRLHEEHDLRDFYRVFNKLWSSGFHEEMSLALYTLQLYEDDFDLSTWKFIKPRLKYMKTWDQVDNFSSQILGKILLKYPRMEREIMRLSDSDNIWLRRIAIVSTLPLIKQGNIKLTMQLAEKYVYDENDYIQKATGWMLREAGKQKPEIVKRFILKHIHMPSIEFSYATEIMKELRRVRQLKKLHASVNKH